MVTIDLITGFLGSGKTTFIKKYTREMRILNKNFKNIENFIKSILKRYEWFIE